MTRWYGVAPGEKCPVCGAGFKVHELIGSGSGPIADGDLTVCGACRDVLVRVRGTWRKARLSDLMGLTHDEAQALFVARRRP